MPAKSHKTIYVRFDLNDYSIPPSAVGRQLTLVASDTLVRILDGTAEVARHRRSYDRHQVVADPAHQQALLEQKRKASSAPSDRLSVAVPQSEAFLQAALLRGESVTRQTRQLLDLLQDYGDEAVARGPRRSTAARHSARLLGSFPVAQKPAHLCCPFARRSEAPTRTGRSSRTTPFSGRIR